MVRKSRSKKKSTQGENKEEAVVATPKKASEDDTDTQLDGNAKNLEATSDSDHGLASEREHFSQSGNDSTNNTVEDSGRQDTETKDDEEKKQPTSSLPFHSSLQKKLFDIRLRMNEGRKLNSQAVEEELKTNHFRSKGQVPPRKTKQSSATSRQNEAATTTSVGLKDKFWRETAEQAEQQLAKDLVKRRRSGQKLIGETIYGEDNLYRAYEKRLTRIPVHEIDPTKAEEEMDPLEYGHGSPVHPDRVEKMVEELEETEERRRKFSKWHKFDEESADISFINERNRRFNEKIARSFDEYTQEIRQNLERGTALP